jgi:ribonuclease P protein component
MTKKLTLQKNERLKSRKLIEQLFSEGKKFVINPYRVFYILEKKEQALLQFGVGVSSRNFKKAVDRNRVKRLIKESYRLQKNLLQDKIKDENYQLNIFVIYTAKELPEYTTTFETMTKVLDKLMVILSEKK